MQAAAISATTPRVRCPRDHTVPAPWTSDENGYIIHGVEPRPKEEQEVEIETADGAGSAAAREAAEARRGLSEAVGTIRVTYPDLHGIQRGKDIPIDELGRASGTGLAFCWAVMGTDLRHTPVVGGESGYPDMVAKPDLSTLIELPWEDRRAHV